MEPHELTTLELAAAVRARRFSAPEVVEHLLARIAAQNPRLNAIVTLDEAGARDRAAAADAARARGQSWGPLHGVPVTLKDCFTTKGMRTTVGYPPLRDHVPDRDGHVATRLLAAGAIVLGKTNVPPLLGGPYTDNPIFGRTNNPWNLERTPGGSSGGSAAAVAARLVPLDIGSDALGSVRQPAHFCGLFGFKPSERRISLDGHLCMGDVPGAPRAWRSIATVGPLARSLADLEFAFGLLAGEDGRDVEVPPLPLASVPTPELSSLRIGVARSFTGVPVAEEVGDAIESLASELGRAGAKVRQVVLPFDVAAACELLWELIPLIGTASTPQESEPTPARIVRYFARMAARDELIVRADAFMRDLDAILCPAAISTAFRHARAREPIVVDGQAVEWRHAAHHCGLFNLTGQPGLVMPYRISSEGLPIGVQLVGRRWHDEALFAVGRAVAEHTGPFVPPPEP